MRQLSPKTFELGDASSGAVFDRRRWFRYRLWRCWDSRLPRVCFIMLNPSTADENKNDPTIARCVAFARRWRFGSLDVVNAFAYRATDSSLLLRVADPVGKGNDDFICESVARSEMTLLAWGNQGRIANRSQSVIELLPESAAIYCFGMTKLGQPRHPLYVAGDTAPVRFTR